MRLEELKPVKNSTKKPKRVGRGPGSGWGTTAARGQKGQKARSGGGKGCAFEGGQFPLARRMPKFGFYNRFRKEYTCVNVEELNIFEANETVNSESLIKAGIVKSISKHGLKILGKGTLEKALTVSAHKFTKSAQEQIEKLNGKIDIIPGAKKFMKAAKVKKER
jgi:large subunit ribosomal protein L15